MAKKSSVKSLVPRIGVLAGAGTYRRWSLIGRKEDGLVTIVQGDSRTLLLLFLSAFWLP